MRRGLMRFLSFYSVFPGLRVPGFEVFLDLFDEVITRVDREGGENESKQGKDGGATVRQVLIYPMAICVSFLPHCSAD